MDVQYHLIVLVQMQQCFTDTSRMTEIGKIVHTWNRCCEDTWWKKWENSFNFCDFLKKQVLHVQIQETPQLNIYNIFKSVLFFRICKCEPKFLITDYKHVKPHNTFFFFGFIYFTYTNIKKNLTCEFVVGISSVYKHFIVDYSLVCVKGTQWWTSLNSSTEYDRVSL